MDTFQKAINNRNLFISWPGIQDINFKKNSTHNSSATAKDHLDQERQGLQSTKVQEDFFSNKENKKTYNI